MNNFDTIVNRLGTYCTQWDFVKDRFGKEGLLPFTISDMDFACAPQIIEKIHHRTNQKIFGYTRWNHSDYKNAIIYWYKKRFDCNIQSQWIAYSPNVMYGIVQFFHLFNPSKDPICFITPCYDGFIKILKANNYPMAPVHQTLTNGNFELNWNELEQKISQSKIFLLCNPNNPNGYLWTKDDLRKIIEICKKYQVAIISDDIHMDFVYKPQQFTPILTVAEEMDYVQHTLIITAHSKTFNLSGIGGAYVLCPNIQILEKYTNILSNCDSLGSAPSLHVETLITGYTECEHWTDELIGYIHQNLKFTQDFLKTHIPTLKTFPQATYFSWIDCRNFSLPMKEIQEKLIHIGNVAIMDGDRYEEIDPFLRMVVACPRVKLEDGLNRVIKSLKK